MDRWRLINHHVPDHIKVLVEEVHGPRVVTANQVMAVGAVKSGNLVDG